MTLHIRSAAAKIGDRLTLIKYESLCDDVRAVMSSLMESAGLTDTGGFLRTLPATLSITNERQYKRCSLEDMRLLNDILQSTLEELGYSPFEIA